MTTFFDTSVLFAAINDSEPHHKWSRKQLITWKAKGPPVVIIDIVYCEFSIGMKNQSDVDYALEELELERYPGSDAILFRAGKAYLKYKKNNKGPKRTVLPDFIIGAAAEVSGSPLVTANESDFVTYFPALQIIKP